MYDVVTSFLEHGLDHLMFLCGHNGNMPILEHVARRIRHERGIRLACLEPWRMFSPATVAEAYGKPIRSGHGSDPITSFWLHLSPEHVRLDLTEQEALTTYPGVDLRGMAQVALGDVAGHIYFDTREVASNGVMGDPSVFNAEAGGKILDQVVARGIEFITIFKGHDTRIARHG
jgi:creatinine amidohydrolase